MTIQRTDPRRVTAIRETLSVPFSGRTVSGYGSKIPTRCMVEYSGKWRRVYAMCYGNAGSLYIRHRGERLFLDISTEYWFQGLEPDATEEEYAS